jgi:hypothetical protein
VSVGLVFLLPHKHAIFSAHCADMRSGFSKMAGFRFNSKKGA